MRGGGLQAFCLQGQGREGQSAAVERELQPLCEGTRCSGYICAARALGVSALHSWLLHAHYSNTCMLWLSSAGSHPHPSRIIIAGCCHSWPHTACRALQTVSTRQHA